MGEDTMKMEHQVFAIVHDIDNYVTCEEEEGILGLANSLTTSHHFPTLLSNVLHKKVWKHNIFGMYLQSRDDYLNEGEGSWQRVNGQHSAHVPIDASSQLVLGGVDQTHYFGCLQWHYMLDPADNDDDNDSSASAAQEATNFWSLPLDKVLVGGQQLSNTNGNTPLLAILDSGSSYVVGPQQAVTQLVKMNGAKCFTMQNFDGASPQQVSCDQEAGFDGAILSNCDDPFFNMEFVIDGIVYVLEKEDLMVHVETLFGEACILRIVGAKGMTVSCW
jgi:Eukaryotic aspartyl protease